MKNSDPYEPYQVLGPVWDNWPIDNRPSNHFSIPRIFFVIKFLLWLAQHGLMVDDNSTTAVD